MCDMEITCKCDHNVYFHMVSILGKKNLKKGKSLRPKFLTLIGQKLGARCIIHLPQTKK